MFAKMSSECTGKRLYNIKCEKARLNR